MFVYYKHHQIAKRKFYSYLRGWFERMCMSADSRDAIKISEFIMESLKPWTKEMRYEDDSDENEAMLLFDLIYDDTGHEYISSIPNSSVYILDGHVQEFDIRFGEIASHQLSVGQLESYAWQAAQTAGTVDIQHVDTGGRQNKRVLHIRTYNTYCYPDEFCTFIRVLCQKVGRELENSS